MSIAISEKLKGDLTDRFVIVAEGVPELRRFVGLTGQVKTVNMNGRALVQFDGPVDISWYDIDPSYLTVIPEPLKKAPPEKAHKAEAASAAKSGSSTVKPAGKSPLEQARAQGAAKAAGGAAPAAEKKLSPLELARQQGAAKAGGAASSRTPSPAGATEKKLSPLELARQQGAAKPGESPSAAPAASVAPAASAAPPAAPPPQPKVAAASARVKPETTAEIIALARQQGPFKG